MFDLFSDQVFAPTQISFALSGHVEAVDERGGVAEVSDRQDELGHPPGLLPRRSSSKLGQASFQCCLHRHCPANLWNTGSIHERDQRKELVSGMSAVFSYENVDYLDYNLSATFLLLSGLLGNNHQRFSVGNDDSNYGYL